MSESRLAIPTPASEIPVLVLEPPARSPRGTVLMYHGLGASKDIQRKELECLARRGFRAVGVDAVGHGDRAWPDLQQRMDDDPMPTLFTLIARSVDEIPAILDALQGWYGPAVDRCGITGISMGGFIAFSATIRDARLVASVPILGSPDWGAQRRLRGKGQDQGEGGRPGRLPPAGPELRRLLRRSPHLRPQAFASKAVLALNAGQDIYVPAVPARAFVEQLRARFPERAHRFAFVEYPESGHFMREQDWNDVLDRMIEWFCRYLPSR